MYKGDLLTKNNAKTKKGEKYGFTTYIQYMSPHKQNSLGKNVCPNASEGCAKACLFKSGFGGIYTSVEQGRINRTEFFLNDKDAYLQYLKKEIERAKKRHEKKGEKICIRLNGTSDLPFESILLEGQSIMEHFSDIQFYDYTKSPKRMKAYLNGEMPANYQLTFSRSEVNDKDAMEVLSNGGNVAMVFNELPAEYNGFKVINGDESDLRFLDEENVIVGLKYKKLNGGMDNEVAFTSGFAITI